MSEDEPWTLTPQSCRLGSVSVLLAGSRVRVGSRVHLRRSTALCAWGMGGRVLAAALHGEESSWFKQDGVGKTGIFVRRILGRPGNRIRA